MAPQEVWWLIESKMPRKTLVGSLTEDDAADLYAHMKEQGIL